MLQFYLSLVETEEERSLITELYTKYEQKMFRAAMDILHNNHSAEDAVHDAFLKIIDKLQELNFDNDVKTGALLVIMVRNISKNMYNKDKRIEISEILEEVVEDNNSFSEYHRLEEVTAKEAISKLPAELRQVIVMRYILEIDVKEIASTLGIAPTTVYARIQKAREVMRKILEESDEKVK